MPKSRRFCLVYLVTQQCKQAVKAPKDKKLRFAYLIVYKLCHKVKKYKSPSDLFGVL